MIGAARHQPHPDFLLKGRIDFLRVERKAKSSCPLERPIFPVAPAGSSISRPARRSAQRKDCPQGRSACRRSFTRSPSAPSALHQLPYCSRLRRPAESMAEKQLDLVFWPSTPFCASLEKLHRDGVFGMRPDANSEYGYAPNYPIATQFVPSHILEAKWELTHVCGTGRRSKHECPHRPARPRSLRAGPRREHFRHRSGRRRQNHGDRQLASSILRGLPEDEAVERLRSPRSWSPTPCARPSKCNSGRARPCARRPFPPGLAGVPANFFRHHSQFLRSIARSLWSLPGAAVARRLASGRGGTLAALPVARPRSRFRKRSRISAGSSTFTPRHNFTALGLGTLPPGPGLSNFRRCPIPMSSPLLGFKADGLIRPRQRPASFAHRERPFSGTKAGSWGNASVPCRAIRRRTWPRLTRRSGARLSRRFARLAARHDARFWPPRGQCLRTIPALRGGHDLRRPGAARAPDPALGQSVRAA